MPTNGRVHANLAGCRTAGKSKEYAGEHMKTLVRRAQLADAELIAPLFDGYRQFYRQSADLPLALAFVRERLMLNESVIFVAQNQQGQAIGFTQLYPAFSSVSARRIWILNDLFVTPGARGNGVARQLLDMAKNHAVATGAKRLALSTARDNPAQKLYESVGYERDNLFYHYSLTLD
jgi:ribosomal protein S18 acetylase RimI-like enzyme